MSKVTFTREELTRVKKDGKNGAVYFDIDLSTVSKEVRAMVEQKAEHNAAAGDLGKKIDAALVPMLEERVNIPGDMQFRITNYYGDTQWSAVERKRAKASKGAFKF